MRAEIKSRCGTRIVERPLGIVKTWSPDARRKRPCKDPRSTLCGQIVGQEMNEARQRLAAVAAGRDERIDVAEAALLIAQEEYPQLDIVAYLAQLDELAARARAAMRPAMTAAEQVAHLNHFLFVESGFAGNNDDYYDPRNSFLNEVIDRRTGIPITLSVVYCEVGRRLGLPVYGVSFPGHFLVKYAGEPEIIIDPFFGTVLTAEECEERWGDLRPDGARLERRLLRPASPREILVRMLSNLKQVYVEQNDAERALACVDRILLLAPDTPRELRDRGILYQRLECYRGGAARLRALPAARARRRGRRHHSHPPAGPAPPSGAAAVEVPHAAAGPSHRRRHCSRRYGAHLPTSGRRQPSVQVGVSWRQGRARREPGSVHAP